MRHLPQVLPIVLTFGLCIGLAATAPSNAKKQALNPRDLPPAVRKTLAVQSSRSLLTRVEKQQRNGKLVYEVTFKTNRVHKTILVNEGGSVLETDEPVSLPNVSPPARRVIMSSVGGGKILRLESVKTAAGIISAYKVRFKKSGRIFELRIAPDGTLAPS